MNFWFSVNQLSSGVFSLLLMHNGVARTLKKLRTSKADYCYNFKQWFSTIMSFLKWELLF